MTRTFRNRETAGRALGVVLLQARKACEHAPLVLGLPRGGVPVAAQVAEALDTDLDVLVVRKLGAPSQPELAIGAIGGGLTIRHDRTIEMLGVSERAFRDVVALESAELARRERLYRSDRPALALKDRQVIVVDDGIATGASMQAAVAICRQQGALHVTVAVPHAATDAAARLRREADEFVCLETPEPYFAVGYWYDDFPQTQDEEVTAALAANRARLAHKH